MARVRDADPRSEEGSCLCPVARALAKSTLNAGRPIRVKTKMENPVRLIRNRIVRVLIIGSVGVLMIAWLLTGGIGIYRSKRFWGDNATMQRNGLFVDWKSMRMSIGSTLRKTVIPCVFVSYHDGPPFWLNVAYDDDADRNEVSFRVVSLSLFKISNGGEKEMEIVVPTGEQMEAQLIKRESYNTFGGDVIVSERRGGEVRIEIQEYINGSVNIQERLGVRAKVEIVNGSGVVDEVILKENFRREDRSGITTFWEYAIRD